MIDKSYMGLCWSGRAVRVREFTWPPRLRLSVIAGSSTVAAEAVRLLPQTLQELHGYYFAEVAQVAFQDKTVAVAVDADKYLGELVGRGTGGPHQYPLRLVILQPPDAAVGGQWFSGLLGALLGGGAGGHGQGAPAAPAGNPRLRLFVARLFSNEQSAVNPGFQIFKYRVSAAFDSAGQSGEGPAQTFLEHWRA